MQKGYNDMTFNKGGCDMYHRALAGAGALLAALTFLAPSASVAQDGVVMIEEIKVT